MIWILEKPHGLQFVQHTIKMTTSPSNTQSNRDGADSKPKERDFKKEI